MDTGNRAGAGGGGGAGQGAAAAFASQSLLPKPFESEQRKFIEARIETKTNIILRKTHQTLFYLELAKSFLNNFRTILSAEEATEKGVALTDDFGELKYVERLVKTKKHNKLNKLNNSNSLLGFNCTKKRNNNID
jgi:hypothetical protein